MYKKPYEREVVPTVTNGAGASQSLYELARQSQSSLRCEVTGGDVQWWYFVNGIKDNVKGKRKTENIFHPKI